MPEPTTSLWRQVFKSTAMKLGNAEAYDMENMVCAEEREKDKVEVAAKGQDFTRLRNNKLEMKLFNTNQWIDFKQARASQKLSRGCPENVNVRPKRVEEFIRVQLFNN